MRGRTGARSTPRGTAVGEWASGEIVGDDGATSRRSRPRSRPRSRTGAATAAPRPSGGEFARVEPEAGAAGRPGLSLAPDTRRSRGTARSTPDEALVRPDGVPTIRRGTARGTATGAEVCAMNGVRAGATTLNALSCRRFRRVPSNRSRVTVVQPDHERPDETDKAKTGRSSKPSGHHETKPGAEPHETQAGAHRRSGIQNHRLRLTPQRP